MIRVLVIDDDAELVEGLKDNLEGEGYEVLTAKNGEQGLLEAARHPPDVVILDLMLPKVGGFDVCRALRKRGFKEPIVMLTARGQERDKIQGLELGADDYLTKPFSIHELLARLRAVIRRSNRPSREMGTYRFADAEINFSRQRLYRKSRTYVLSHLETEVLHYFVTHLGQVVRREDVLAAIWGYEAFTTRAVDNLVTRLRNKIEDDPHHPRHILSAYGLGYKFVD